MQGTKGNLWACEVRERVEIAWRIPEVYSRALPKRYVFITNCLCGRVFGPDFQYWQTTNRLSRVGKCSAHMYAHPVLRKTRKNSHDEFSWGLLPLPHRQNWLAVVECMRTSDYSSSIIVMMLTKTLISSVTDIFCWRELCPKSYLFMMGHIALAPSTRLFGCV